MPKTVFSYFSEKQNSLLPCPKCVSSCRELLSKLSLREVVKSREVVLSLTGSLDNLLNYKDK